MAKQNKWIAGLVLGVVAVIGISSLAFAQRTWRSCNSWTGRDVPLEYRLDQEQAQETGKIRAEYQEKILVLEKQHAAKRVEMDAEWARSDGDPARMRELRREIRDIEYKIEDIQIEAGIAAAKHLSPEQRRFYGDDFCVWADSGWSCSSCQWDDGYRGSTKMSGRWGSGWHGSRGNCMDGGYCCR
jgi:Spy/CpxP family protein refolding chaperone